MLLPKGHAVSPWACCFPGHAASPGLCDVASLVMYCIDAPQRIVTKSLYRTDLPLFYTQYLPISTYCRFVRILYGHSCISGDEVRDSSLYFTKMVLKKYLLKHGDVWIVFYKLYIFLEYYLWLLMKLRDLVLEISTANEQSKILRISCFLKL